MTLTGINLSQLATVVIVAIILIAVGTVLFHVLKRVIAGCISIGCGVLLIGIIALILMHFLPSMGVNNLSGLFHIFVR